MTGRLVLGVDIGLDGAIAALQGDQVVLLADMPVVPVLRGKGKRRELLVPELVDLLRGVLVEAPAGARAVAFVEAQSARPAQGVTSCFRLGLGQGVALGALAALGIGYELAAPAKWKRAMGLPAGAGKGDSIRRALELHPEADIGRRDGRAEALLIADYGARRLAGGACP